MECPLAPHSRRLFLQRSGLGFGSLALASLLDQDGLLSEPTVAAESKPRVDLLPRRGHFPARAKSVIMLFQSGAPSQMDLFDPKPALQRQHGKDVGIDSLQGRAREPLMASPFSFRPRGESGIEFSELVPHLGSVADDLCVIRSMYTFDPCHAGAPLIFLTGKLAFGRPTLGSWVGYALGTENQNLPSYVVLHDIEGHNTAGAALWDNGWLPALYRGTEFRPKGSPVLNLRAARKLPAGADGDDLRLIGRLNQKYADRFPQATDLETRIRNYELAARMQLAAEKNLDLSTETATTKKLYGLENPATAEYGTQCLMARRLVEAGVRFIQIMNKPHNPWDHHSNLKTRLPQTCLATDQPSAALISDLKQRGLLEDTLVVWVGEFGRLPTSQGGTGRDHNMHAFTALAAGGGLKHGHIHGATDEFGHRAEINQVSVLDLLATILHQVGLDHTRLTYKHNNLEESLTDARTTDAAVVGELLQGPVLA
ncbi:MAG TPA: DUF1501 domain-containing protein [Planctomycetaceae bacterium]|nr:DUF1501 domain-containing protein [Planctomycetaceae bacterium]